MMLDLCVFTSSYSHPPADMSLLCRSCERIGIDIHTYGEGTSWPGYGQRIVDAAEFLRGRKEHFALFTDSQDTFLLGSDDLILSRFDAIPADILFSAEPNCWPDASLADHFPPSPTKWRFLNAGGWMGLRTCLIQMLEEASAFLKQWPEDDTRCFVEWFLTRPPFDPADDPEPVVKIDYTCQIFQCMYMYEEGDLDEMGMNTITGTYPLVHHFNGRSPGYRENYTKFTGDKL